MSIFEQFLQNTAAAGRRNGRKKDISRLAAQLIENEKTDSEQYPEDAEKWKPFFNRLKAELEMYSEFDVWEPVDASIKFFITSDRMDAYACMLPPLDGGADMYPEMFVKELEQNGIKAGIDENALTYITRKRYLHIFPVARGTKSEDGIDGSLEYLFEPWPVFKVEVQNGAPADFSVMKPAQLIKRGEPLCNVIPETKGKEGVDVTGRKLPCKDGLPIEVPVGHNMQLSEDGLHIEATENGAVIQKDGEYYVQTAIVRRGDLKSDDDLVWLAFIDGDIPEGIKVLSTSNVVVMGEIRGAEIYSNGTVRAQGGIKKGSHIEAKRQVLAPVIESSYIKAGMDIYAEKIKDCDINCDGSIYVTGGDGIIEGGVVRARDKVECIQVGNEAGIKNKFILGFWIDLEENIDRLSGEMDGVQSTLEKLRKNILGLRMGGDTLSMEKRELLGQLVEQKELYEERAAEIDTQLKEAKNKRRSGQNSQIVCQKMFPVTEVQISSNSSTFAYPETRCRIHLYAGQVVSK